MGQKLVIATGISTGIGFATAELLASSGYTVVGCARAETVNWNDASHIHYLSCDIKDEEQLQNFKQLVDDIIGDDLESVTLINNAAFSPVMPLEAVDKSEFDEVLHTNAIAPLRLIQLFLPLMKRVPSRIINISPGAGVLAVPTNGVYSMSKFALEAMSDVLRVEFRRYGIKTIVVQPGLIHTSIHGKAVLQFDHIAQKVREAFEKQLHRAIIKQAEDAKSATKPIAVAEVIKHAMEVAKPKSRYGAGPDAKALRKIHWLMSDKIRDALMIKRGGW